MLCVAHAWQLFEYTHDWRLTGGTVPTEHPPLLPVTRGRKDTSVQCEELWLRLRRCVYAAQAICSVFSYRSDARHLLYLEAHNGTQQTKRLLRGNLAHNSTV
jgi:hypothetical protein